LSPLQHLTPHNIFTSSATINFTIFVITFCKWFWAREKITNLHLISIEAVSRAVQSHHAAKQEQKIKMGPLLFTYAGASTHTHKKVQMLYTSAQSSFLSEILKIFKAATDKCLPTQNKISIQ